MSKKYKTNCISIDKFDVQDVVEKANHCLHQIHYHIVSPVKYRRGLLDEAAVKIITL